MCSSDVICVTNRLLCQEDFLRRLDRIAAAHPRAVILREKDLSETEYRALAGDALEICARHGVDCILHQFAEAALDLNAAAIHLPLSHLRSLNAQQKARFSVIGASCHSLRDAQEAEKLGCSYITAGHVFDTECKQGTPGRGIDFLREICAEVKIPVYAIGGIAPEKMKNVRAAGAAGGCVMRALMRCTEPEEYLKMFF